MKGVVLMQTSGFALIANALASLVVPSQIPAIMVISERGTLGEFNVGQALVARTMRPVLDSLGIVHHTLSDQANMQFIVDRSIKQAVSTRAPVAFILSPPLTGGPILLAVKIDDRPGVGKTVRDPALIRNRFMKGLGTGRDGALDA